MRHNLANWDMIFTL